MPSHRDDLFGGRGPNTPKGLLWIIRKWGITPALRAKVVAICERKIDDPNSSWEQQKDAARLLAMLDSQDDRAEGRGEAARQADAMISLEAVRTQLAAQLAAGQAGMTAIPPGRVIPSHPPPAQLTEPEVPAPPACPECGDTSYVTTAAGATPCPACNSDRPPGERPPAAQTRRAVRMDSTPLAARRERHFVGESESDGPPVDPADLAY